MASVAVVAACAAIARAACAVDVLPALTGVAQQFRLGLAGLIPRWRAVPRAWRWLRRCRCLTMGEFVAVPPQGPQPDPADRRGVLLASDAHRRPRIAKQGRAIFYPIRRIEDGLHGGGYERLLGSDRFGCTSTM